MLCRRQQSEFCQGKIFVYKDLVFVKIKKIDNGGWTMKKVISLFLALGVCVITLMGCSGKAPGSSTSAEAKEETKEQTDFTIAFATWIGYAPLFIAEEKGYFKEAGISPKITIIEDESEYAAAMVSNSIQGLGNVLDREIIHFALGTPEKFLFAMDESAGGDGVIASGEIKSVADLKGKTVALDKSSTSYFFFLTILKENGLKEDDVTITEMGASDAGAAFVAGKVDAAVTWEPWLTNASQREGGHVLASSKDYPKTIVDVLTVRSDFAAANPKTVAALEEAWYKAIDFYKQNPQEGNLMMAKGLGLDEKEIADMAAGVSFFGRDENKAFYDKNTENNIYEVAKRAADFWLEKGIIKNEVDLPALIDKVNP